MRMARQSDNALKIASWLETQSPVARVYYPGLASHPQHALAMSQQKTSGAIVSFEVGHADEDRFGSGAEDPDDLIADLARGMAVISAS